MAVGREGSRRSANLGDSFSFCRESLFFCRESFFFCRESFALVGGSSATWVKSHFYMYWYIFHQGHIVLTESGEVPRSTACPLPLPPDTHVLRLPDLQGEACRAVEVADFSAAGGLRAEGLRESFYHLPLAHYRMAGKARELLHWDAGSRYCSACGHELAPHTDISKRCPACGREVWPPLAVAIIVLVKRGADEVLLVQSKNFRRDYLGLVAGFVETGETLEECLRREVREETGLEVQNIRYVASQPWPFPNVLMVGFVAEYAGGEIRLQRSELNKGGWYHRTALPEIPGRVSLARQLIDAWLEGRI